MPNLYFLMLLSFSVENFKSIRDLQTLSLVAAKGGHLEWSNTLVIGKRRLVKSVALYGPNASGKSNVLNAMIWFRNFVLTSSKETQSGESIGVQPFKLSTKTLKNPSHFEVEFLIDDHEYRYGFEVNSERVVSEWLYRKSQGAKAAKLFTRDENEYDISANFFKEGKGLEKRTRDNALFLSVCAQFNGDIATKVLNWMQRLRNVSGLTESGFFGFTAERLQDKKNQKELLNFAQKADFNIQSLASELEFIRADHLPDTMPENLKKRIIADRTVGSSSIKTTHSILDENDQVVGQQDFDLKADESEGTQKFIALSGPITHTLETGSILLIDELDARLHPRLTQAIVDLFHSPVNRHNAQLICATHDVTLMEPERFRRDQIWFCDKDKNGATELFNLGSFDVNQVRPNSKFSRQYMLGLFGALPNLAHFQEAAELATHE